MLCVPLLVAIFLPSLPANGGLAGICCAAPTGQPGLDGLVAVLGLVGLHSFFHRLAALR